MPIGSRSINSVCTDYHCAGLFCIYPMGVCVCALCAHMCICVSVCVYLCVGTDMCITECMSQSESNFQVFIFFFYHVRFRDQSQEWWQVFLPHERSVWYCHRVLSHSLFQQSSKANSNYAFYISWHTLSNKKNDIWTCSHLKNKHLCVS